MAVCRSTIQFLRCIAAVIGPLIAEVPGIALLVRFAMSQQKKLKTSKERRRKSFLFVNREQQLVPDEPGFCQNFRRWRDGSV
ncbi:MAG: hypothetical protein IPK57_15595 [Chitinophagaceae bacterium]|nr:hypothetical protein [Chitinophagaceae bacterium]